MLQYGSAKTHAGSAYGYGPALYHLQCVHSRYNLKTNPNPFTKHKTFLVFILANLLLVPIVCGINVHVFPKVGAIAERCGNVAFQLSSTIFSIVLRLNIPTPRVPQWHCHNGSTHLEQFLHDNIDGALLPTWVSDNYRSTLNLPNNNYPIRKKRFILPLISMVTGIGGLAAGIYSAIESQSIKTAQAELRDHVQNLQRKLQEDHQEILEITKNTKKLYKYFYTQFLSIADKINSIPYDLQDLLKTLANYIVITGLQAKMYVDLIGAIE